MSHPFRVQPDGEFWAVARRSRRPGGALYWRPFKYAVTHEGALHLMANLLVHHLTRKGGVSISQAAREAVRLVAEEAARIQDPARLHQGPPGASGGTPPVSQAGPPEVPS